MEWMLQKVVNTIISIQNRNIIFAVGTCLAKFKDDPEHYLTDSAHKEMVAANDSSIYICQLHLEIRLKGTGSC